MICRQALRAERMERLFHGIERLTRAGENAVLENRREPGFDWARIGLAP